MGWGGGNHEMFAASLAGRSKGKLSAREVKKETNLRSSLARFSCQTQTSSFSLEQMQPFIWMTL